MPSPAVLRLVHLLLTEHQLRQQAAALRRETDLALLDARRSGTPYKAIAGELVDQLEAAPTEASMDRFVLSLRTRANAASRRVSPPHDRVVAAIAANDEYGTKDIANMNTPYRRRVVEEWFETGPSSTPAPPLDPNCEPPDDELDGVDDDDLPDHDGDE